MVNEHLFPLHWPGGETFNTVEEYAHAMAASALRFAQHKFDSGAVYASAVRERKHERRVAELADDLAYVASLFKFHDRHALVQAWDEVICHALAESVSTLGAFD